MRCACSTHGREDQYVVSFGRKNEGNRLQEDLVVDRRIIIKYFSIKAGHATVD